MKSPTLRVRIALNFPDSIADLIAYAKRVLKAMTNNPNFPNPNPSLAVFAADIAALEEWESNALNGIPGAADERDVKAEVVRNDMRHLADGVEQVAEAKSAEALPITESSGFPIAQVGHYIKQGLAAKRGKIAGVVILLALAVKGGSAYHWEMGFDKQTFNPLPPTIQAHTTVTGLTLGQTVYFRLRVLTRDGMGDYGNVVTYVVH